MNTQEVITTRKSVRAYTSEQLTEAELSTILDAAYVAPVAGGAYQKMRLTVVQNAAMLQKISDAYREEGVKRARRNSPVDLRGDRAVIGIPDRFLSEEIEFLFYTT